MISADLVFLLVLFLAVAVSIAAQVIVLLGSISLRRRTYALNGTGVRISLELRKCVCWRPVRPDMDHQVSHRSWEASSCPSCPASSSELQFVHEMSYVLFTRGVKDSLGMGRIVSLSEAGEFDYQSTVHAVSCTSTEGSGIGKATLPDGCERKFVRIIPFMPLKDFALSIGCCCCSLMVLLIDPSPSRCIESQKLVWHGAGNGEVLPIGSVATKE